MLKKLKRDIRNIFDLLVRNQLEIQKGFFHTKRMTMRSFNDKYEYLIKINDQKSRRVFENFILSKLKI